MQSRNRTVRTGNHTTRIYPRVALAAMAVRNGRCLQAAIDATGMTRDSITVCISNMEKKLGVKLFIRSQGRGHYTWTPILEPATEDAWARIREVAIRCVEATNNRKETERTSGPAEAPSGSRTCLDSCWRA